MSDERRLDMDQVIGSFAQLRQQPAHCAGDHHPVFRIERKIPGGHAQRAVVLRVRIGVGGRDQVHLMAERRKLAAERLDGRGYAVHPREVHVRDHQYFHVSFR